MIDAPPTHEFHCGKCGRRWLGKWGSGITECPGCGNVTSITVRTIRRRDTNAA